MSACAVACSSFYFAKGWHFISLFTVCPLLLCRPNRVADNVRYLRWQDILCSVTPVPKLINVLLLKITFCCLIFNVQPELKLIKVLLPIVLPSSPAIANTFVSGSYFSLSSISNFFLKSALILKFTGLNSTGIRFASQYFFPSLSLLSLSENIFSPVIKLSVTTVSVV